MEAKNQKIATSQKSKTGKDVRISTYPQEWFEMNDIRISPMSVDSWVTIKSIQILSGESFLTEKNPSQEIYSVGSVMFPIIYHEEVLNFGWDNSAHFCQFDGGVETVYRTTEDRISNEIQESKAISQYLPCGYYNRGSIQGSGLVIDQHVNSQENPVWHLHQDFVVALNLIREDDKWIRPEEGYVEVARLSRNSEGKPNLIEVRKELLLDYLFARKMNLYLYSYHSRRELANDHGHFSWEPKKEYVKEDEMRRWAGRIIPMPLWKLSFGYTTEKHNTIASEGVHDTDGIPEPKSNYARNQTSNMDAAEGQIYMIIGELWRTEVIEAGDRSERVLDDEPTSVPFIIDSTGRPKNNEFLKASNSWLHFRPEVINVILGRRGASLWWITSYTGGISLASGHSIHFGVNNAGHINVFAKDIAQLPSWQQRVWAGSNITPEEEVSRELFASQFEANPANSIAPEDLLQKAYTNINDTASEILGMPIFHEHEYGDKLFGKCHRFRAIERSGLYELAKDLCRLTIEGVDQAALRVVAKPQNGEAWKSINHLETVLAKWLDEKNAREIVNSLRGLNRLRQADAHMLSQQEIEKSISRAGISETGDPIHEAYQMIQKLAETLNEVAEVMRVHHSKKH